MTKVVGAEVMTTGNKEVAMEEEMEETKEAATVVRADGTRVAIMIKDRVVDTEETAVKDENTNVVMTAKNKGVDTVAAVAKANTLRVLVSMKEGLVATTTMRPLTMPVVMVMTRTLACSNTPCRSLGRTVSGFRARALTSSRLLELIKRFMEAGAEEAETTMLRVWGWVLR